MGHPVNHQRWTTLETKASMLGRITLLAIPFTLFLACDGENPAEPRPDNADSGSTVTLEPAKDNTLFEDSAGALSNGAGQFLFSGVTNQPGIRRAVLQFTVAGGAIPAGATVDSAVLTLHMSRTVAGPTTVGLHRLTTDSGEAGSDAAGAEGDGTPALPATPPGCTVSSTRIVGKTPAVTSLPLPAPAPSFKRQASTVGDLRPRWPLTFRAGSTIP